ncbi:cyclin-like protein [Vararia minispora EC-137]|uniref:Cyclin-like protein n=1 Tax=Vararia minispora EC-137 TaxID=1314806 RepID=A0ACB8QGV5_9AGAM|nr:cyclin-like protein [Vararia minispora EC-137]
MDASSYSHTIRHHPYFTPDEVDFLSEKQRGKLSTTQEEKARQQACAFMEAVGSRIGFPRKTIATAQNLYHRFHLFFPRKDHGFHEVSLAALYVSTKMHDTLKKPREILMASYAVRYPELAAKPKSLSGDIDMDPNVVEMDRQRLLGVERLILETICFNFTSRTPFPYVIKMGKALNASKRLTKLGWRLTVDCQRTLAPLEYPPHVIAFSGLYLASLLSTFEREPAEAHPDCKTKTDHEIMEMLRTQGSWERLFQVQVEDVEVIAHALLDILIAAAQNPTAATSPSTPSSPSPNLSRAQQQPHAAPVQSPWKPDYLVRLKIAMRECEHPPRDRIPLIDAREAERQYALLGRNEGTLRFLFGPAGAS